MLTAGRSWSPRGTTAPQRLPATQEYYGKPPSARFVRNSKAGGHMDTAYGRHRSRYTHTSLFGRGRLRSIYAEVKLRPKLCTLDETFTVSRCRIKSISEEYI